MPEPAHRIRVLLVTTTFPGVETDGTPRFILARAQALRADVDVLVVAPAPRGTRSGSVGGVRVGWSRHLPGRFAALPGDGILATLRRAPLRWLEVPLFTAALLLRTLGAAAAHRPHVILAHWILPAGLIGVAVGRALRVPVIITVHGADAYADLGRALHRLRCWALGRADAVVAVTSAIAERVGARTARIQPSGLDFDAWSALAGRRRPVAGRLVFVGRLVEKKGLDVLLAACALVPEVHLRVVGDGPERPALERTVRRLGLDRRVEFVGRGGAAVVAAEMATAMAVVVPSRPGSDGDDEGFPNVITEAVAARAPVIASRLDGIAEHLTDRVTALLVAAEDRDGLAAAIMEVAADPGSADRRAVRAQQVLEPTLGIGAVRRFHLELIREVLARR